MDEQSGFNLLQAAVFEGEYDIVSKAAGLLDNFVKEMELTKTGNNAKNFPGKTAVDILSLMERKELNHYYIKKLYKECAKDNSRLAELQWSKCNDDVEQAVELVLKDGVDINASGSDNDWPALLQASRSSSSQFIETLIDLGADVNARRKRRKETPLILTADCNNFMAACLLLRHGAGVNVQNSSGSTPLHLSVKKNRKSLVRLLLAYNAGVNIRDNAGRTALHQSVRNGDKNLVRLFIEHNADVNIQDKDGHTPLHQAAINRNKNLVRLFLERNADVNIQNKYGETPLLLSIKMGHENLFTLLAEHSADVGRDKNLIRVWLSTTWM